MQARDKKPATLVNLQGQIERVTYTNDENGYTIAQLKAYGQKELVTVVGNLMAPTPGEIIRMRGEWANHPKYGEQFKIVQYKSMVPASVYGIEQYLGSGLIKGIGPVMAKRIVQVFGKETLEVIEKDAEKLAEVHGTVTRSSSSWPIAARSIIHAGCARKSRNFANIILISGLIVREILELEQMANS